LWWLWDGDRGNHRENRWNPRLSAGAASVCRVKGGNAMYAIQKAGYFIAGVRSVMGQPMALMTANPADAKLFRTQAAAEKFLAKWAGAGVGMSKDICEIVDLSKGENQ
jgi:hypothetical protein